MLEARQPENDDRSGDTPEIVPDVSAETVNLSEMTLDEVRADLLRMADSTARDLHASEADVRQSAVLRMEGETIDVHNGISGLVQAGAVNSYQSQFGLVQSQQLSLDSGTVVFVYAGTAEIKDGQAGLVVARQVTGGPVSTAVLLAGQVNGPVETLLDTRQTLLAGLTAGVAIGLVLLVGRWLGGRS